MDFIVKPKRFLLFKDFVFFSVPNKRTSYANK